MSSYSWVGRVLNAVIVNSAGCLAQGSHRHSLALSAGQSLCDICYVNETNRCHLTMKI